MRENSPYALLVAKIASIFSAMNDMRHVYTMPDTRAINLTPSSEVARYQMKIFSTTFDAISFVEEKP
jgi:hypothetical protein